MSEVPPELLAWRRRTGADRWDEVWEGVLHMAPGPSADHQRLAVRLSAWLLRHWATTPDRDVIPEINVCAPGCENWTLDFRMPDIALITADGNAVDRESHFEGGPDVVIEVRSPGDETHEKLAFYAEAGCREIWVIDRDTRECLIHGIEGGLAVPRAADADGWVTSAFGVQMCTEQGRLSIQLVADRATRTTLP